MISIPAFITRHVLIALLLGGFAGILFVLFLIEFDHVTGSEEFCTGCHSMELVAEPYRDSAHYNPASGVRASCGDCHVSEGVFAATWDHILGEKIYGLNYSDLTTMTRLSMPCIRLMRLLPPDDGSKRTIRRPAGAAMCRMR